MIKRILLILGIFILILAVMLAFLSYRPVPEQITYGMSFNTPYARELGLNWIETYDAILDDLNVRHLRLAAHWPMIEPNSGIYNFTELDYQISRAEEVGVEVILAVGRRLPRWPECHIPNWADGLSESEFEQKLLSYISEVVNRYKDSSAVKIWQVENEPFLEVFAYEHCGQLNKELLDKEIALVKELDSSRKVLITDSGNLGLWIGPYKRGDLFGTSVYVHFWNPELGQFRTVLPPAAYRLKTNLMHLFFGKKPTMLIELSAEPWLLEPVTNVPIDIQFTRMDTEKFADILEYAKKTRYEEQYLWGAEWWYWLYLQGEDEMWHMGKELFN